MTTDKTNNYRQHVADMFSNILSEKELNWKIGWNTNFHAPFNAITNSCYRGANRFYLSMVALEKNYDDPRWATFKQIQEKGWKVKKGSKSAQVEYWMPYDREQKKNISWKEYNTLINTENTENRFSINAKYYNVFNASNIEGIPEYKVELNNKVEVSNIIPIISKNMNVPIFNDGGDNAFYNTLKDEIHVPSPKFFKTDYDYNSTVLHELSHASGASHRLQRDMSGKFGSTEYAYEELIAEISSAFMSEHIDLMASEEHFTNHKAYVQHWIKIIKDKPEALFKAIKEADKTATYLEYQAELIEEKHFQNKLGESLELINANDEINTKVLQPHDTMAIEKNISTLTLRDWEEKVINTKQHVSVYPVLEQKVEELEI